MSFAQSEEENVIIEQLAGIPSNTTVYQTLINKSNVKLLATSSGVYRVSDFSKGADQISEESSQCIYLDSKERLFIGTENKVINKDSGLTYNLPDNSTVRALEQTRGLLYVGTNNGVYIFNTKSGKLTDHKTSENSKLESNKILFLHLDAYSVLWVGTGKGTLRVEDKKWNKPYEKNEEFRVVKENKEAVWMITDKEFWFIYEGNRWTPLGLKNDWFQGPINDMTFDSKGRMYLASNVLTRVDPYNEKIEMYSNDLALVSKKCLSIACDVNNQIWIGTENNGLYRIRFSDNEADRLSAVCIIENEIKCNGNNIGSVVVNASGGTKPYKYKWSKSSMRGKNPKNLKPGSYTVTVTDKNKVEFVSSVEIIAPEALVINVLETTRISGRGKKDGSATIEITGGTQPYSILWDNDETSLTASSLKKGFHDVVITDKNNCKTRQSIEIKREPFIPELQADKITIGQTLRINELYFDADSSIIKTDSYDVLDEVYEFLYKNDKIVIEIGGHTNTIPSHEYCDKLSSERARNVAEYLYNKGLSKDRISFKGYGKRKPISKGKSFSARKKNQRVEVKIISMGNP